MISGSVFLLIVYFVSCLNWTFFCIRIHVPLFPVFKYVGSSLYFVYLLQFTCILFFMGVYLVTIWEYFNNFLFLRCLLYVNLCKID